MSMSKSVREHCLGCGAPVDPYTDECKYCHRTYRRKHDAVKIFVAGAATAAVCTIALAVTLKIKLDAHITLGKRSD